MTRWLVRRGPIDLADRPRIMGIVNPTPDSFSDGGRFATRVAASRHALQLVEDGADLLDIGGESSRPGAQPISLDEELTRVIPLIEHLRARINLPISVDTTKPAVAVAAVTAGADVVNDIGGLIDPAMIRVAATQPVGVVLMHMRGSPPTMQADPIYRDVVDEVASFLRERVQALDSAGIARERIAVDPGIGFGKTFEHNCRLLRELRTFRAIGCPLLIGTSRKGFLGAITGKPVAERQAASVVSALAAVRAGANVVRVHDVAATREAFQVWEAQLGGERSE